MSLNSFSKKLLLWFAFNKRNLPWRHTKDPYIIWLSEVILQQTRVAQGLPYFEKFVANYPTIVELSLANEVEVLKLWQGLGYYSRARSMLQTAKEIVGSGNKFPNTYDKLIGLRGIGDYTASAIASFSSNECVAVVDGNVLRVLSRYFGIREPVDTAKGKRKIKSIALQLLPKKQTDDYNQSIMEFGAIQCKPKKPNCETCPLVGSCYAFTNNSVAYFPVKEKKQTKKKINLHYLVFSHNEHLLIRQRKGLGVWEGMYDFESIESTQELGIDEIIKNVSDNYPFSVLDIKTPHKPYKHILSHIEYAAFFWQLNVASPIILNKQSNTRWVTHEILDSLPIPRLVEKYLES